MANHKRSRTRADETQLYTILNKLSLMIPREDELSSLLGYTIVNSLIGFKTDSGSPQEVAFQEVDAVHQGFQRAIAECSSQTETIVLSTLENSVNNFIDALSEAIPADRSQGISSPLLTSIVRYLLSGTVSYPSKLQNSGLELKRYILRRGKLHGRKNILTEDHRELTQYFTTRRRK